MKPLSRLIKGTLISLMLVMVLGMSSNLLISQAGFSGVPVAYADEHDEDEDDDNDLEKIKELSEEMDKIEEELKANQTVDEAVAGIKPPQETPEAAADKDELIRKVARTANWTHRLFAPLINFFSFQIGNFLGTDYIF